jgi:methylmalonyl-CoA/ethylmalonyl-CoA epimerase
MVDISATSLVSILDLLKSASVEGQQPGGIADRLDHVSIATRKLSSLVPLIRDVLGARFLMGATEAAQGFRWAQFQFPGGGVIELLEPFGEDSFLESFLKERGEGLHHITLRVRDIAKRAKELEALGYRPFRPNFDNPVWKEFFLHPKATHGVLIQLAESELPYGQEVEYYQQLSLEDL